MKDARGHGSNGRGGMARVSVDPSKIGYRIADIGAGGKEHNVVVTGGSLGYSGNSNSGAPHAQDRAAAAALATGHPKQGLTGIHSANRVTQAVRAARMAFRKGV